MKKLLLSSLLVAGTLIPVSAQDFYLVYQDQPVDNGALIEYTEFEWETVYYPDPTTGEDVPFGISWKLDPNLSLVSETAGSYTIQIKSNIADLKLCTLLDANDPATGTCMTGNTELVKTPVVMAANEPRNLQLDYDEATYPYEENATYDFPAIEATISVWNLENTSEVYSVTLKMGGFQAAGVESVLADGGTVAFNGKALSYDLPSVSNIAVYSLSGRVMLNKQISGNGVINLENLPKGIYLYKISGKANKTAKIIIR